MAASKKIVQEKTVSKPPVKNIRKILVIALILIVVGGLLFGLAKISFVASVNGKLISRMSVIKELEKQNGQKTLDVIVLKTLVDQEAKKKKIVVNQSDIDTEIKKIEASIVSQGLTLDELLQQQGMTKDSLNEEIRIQLELNKLVGNDVAVSDKEVSDYITSQSSQATAGTTQPMTKEQATTQLKQQKLQQKIQTYLADLKAKAKINYFIKY